MRRVEAPAGLINDIPPRKPLGWFLTLAGLLLLLTLGGFWWQARRRKRKAPESC